MKRRPPRATQSRSSAASYVYKIQLYDDYDELPEEVQLIVANMMFNMGRTRLSKFKGMKRGVDSRDWNAAADEMVDSKWYRQVTNRADRLVQRMRRI